MREDSVIFMTRLWLRVTAVSGCHCWQVTNGHMLLRSRLQVMASPRKEQDLWNFAKNRVFLLQNEADVRSVFFFVIYRYVATKK